MGFARHVIPRGGKYPEGAEDDPELIDRLDDFVAHLDQLSKRGVGFAFFHVNYMNLINIVVMMCIYTGVGVLLSHLKAPAAVWVITILILTVIFILSEMFQSLHFGIEPLHKMDEEKGEKFLETLETSRLAPKRQLFMALKGMVTMAFYSSEKYEKFIGVYEHYRKCGEE